MKTRTITVGLLAVALAIGAFVVTNGSRSTPVAPVVEAAPATPLPVPTGEVILSVNREVDGQQQLIAQFDLPMLQNLPTATFETTTMWTDGVQQFQGVDLKTFMTSLGVTSGTLIATAINDYRVEIPMAEVKAGGPMIAYLMNGLPMSVRDKGPLWIVYPFDSNPDYQTEVVFSRSIWQLKSIAVTP